MDTPLQAQFTAHYSQQRDDFNQYLAAMLTAEPKRSGSLLNPTEQEGLPLLNPLWEALNHACLLGGKRLRPLLVIEVFGQLTRHSVKAVYPLAASIELVHTQSLILDDLPCMDDDRLRRGQPTLHVKFTEATALLAADGLLGFSFGLLSRELRQSGFSPSAILEVTEGLSDVASFHGLVNGQAADIFTTDAGKASRQEALYIVRNKTAALIRFALRSPAVLVEADTDTINLLDELGVLVGTLFQLRDDELDKLGTTEQLGKTAGKDEAQGKLTLSRILGAEAARNYQKNLAIQLAQTINQLSKSMDTEGLELLIDYCLKRAY